MDRIRQKKSLALLPMVLVLSFLDGFFEIRPRSLDAETTEQKPVTIEKTVIYMQPVKKDGYDPRIKALIRQYPDECADKEHLLTILLHAGREELAVDDCLSLPRWSEVSELYGDAPVVYGLETCEQYRQMVASSPNLPPAPRVGGLYNTGTNALSESFNMNFESFDSYMTYNLLGGKHVAPKKEWFSTFPYLQQRKAQLPVVLIRDPFRWMLSMCRVGYGAKWNKGLNGRCPNLVPNAREKKFFPSSTFSVNVSMKGKQYWDYYESLSDLWSTWYRLWLDADYPRLMIRFEDTLFHSEQVTALIAECAGLDYYNASQFRYHVEAAHHSQRTASFTSALSKYGRSDGRYNNLEPQDIEYLRRSLDPKLLELFHYKQVPWNVKVEAVEGPAAPINNNLQPSQTMTVAPVARSFEDSVTEIVSRYPSCLGKERLVEILLRSGQEHVSSDDCDMLPTWKEITDLYGDKPVVYGLESCERYRYQISAEANGGVARNPTPRVAGLFNTGTNVLAMTFNLNLKNEDDYRVYNMPGGKHVPASWKYSHNKPEKYELEDLQYIMPIVAIRDPLRWMQSTCKSPYGAKWQRGQNGRCPNLVPGANEIQLAEFRELNTFHVIVDRDVGEQHTSLADMWSEWNMEYANAAFPRLMVRFEDLLFHAEEVTQLVADCVGMEMTQPFQYQVDKAKSHTDTSDIKAALAKYGRMEGRYDGLLPEDIEYAAQALDPQLLRVFHYPSMTSPKRSISVSSFDERDVNEQVEELITEIGDCRGKEKLVAILLRAGLTNITKDHCTSLPSWDEVASLYGNEPVVFGLETCQRYRESLSPKKNNGTVIEPAPRVAGLFNTGTNALAQSLSLNVKFMEDYKAYNVPSRKHVPARDKWLYDGRFADDFTTEELRRSLPITLIRDPFRWMQSMCKKGYNAEWDKGIDGRCPNLVPTELERQVFAENITDTFNLTLRVREVYRESFESLATLWSEWNRLYLDTFRPRLMIRFEDTLFHPEKVMHIIQECVGAPTTEPYKYFLESSKHHGDPADFVTALARYGRADGRYNGLTAEEARYLQTALDSELMAIFGYPQIPVDDGADDLSVEG